MNVLSVETNFFKCRDFLDGQDQLCFSQSRFFKLRLFSQDFDTSRFLSRLLRHVEIVEICWDAVEICWEILTLSRPFESENDEKSLRIEKSQWENTKIHALLDRDQDKLSRNAKIFRSRQISWSRLRLFGLDPDFSTVETHSLTTSRSRKIETPRLPLYNYFWWSVIMFIDLNIYSFGENVLNLVF